MLPYQRSHPFRETKERENLHTHLPWTTLHLFDGSVKNYGNQKKKFFLANLDISINFPAIHPGGRILLTSFPRSLPANNGASWGDKGHKNERPSMGMLENESVHNPSAGCGHAAPGLLYKNFKWPR